MTQDMVALIIIGAMLLVAIIPLLILVIACMIEAHKTARELEGINREIRELNGGM